MADENQGGFRITDRRLFNADGTLREEGSIAEAPAPEPEPQPAYQAEFQSEFSAEYQAQSPEQYVEELPGDEPERTLFTDFLMQIASSAFIYLGLVEHPATGRPQVNLEAAQETIEIIDMLREKTRGNLTRGEDKLFDELLADLKMQFLARRR